MCHVRQKHAPRAPRAPRLRARAVTYLRGVEEGKGTSFGRDRLELRKPRYRGGERVSRVGQHQVVAFHVSVARLGLGECCKRKCLAPVDAAGQLSEEVEEALRAHEQRCLDESSSASGRSLDELAARRLRRCRNNLRIRSQRC